MFGKRLKIVRLMREYTLESLAEDYNKRYDASISKGTLSKYENEKQEPMMTVVKNLSNLLNITADYLMGKTDSMVDSIPFEFNNIKPITTKKFPMIGEIACGKPIMCNQDYETFIEASANINADFCLTAKGDSMINARIFDGDVVFIHQQPDVENGEIAAVVIEDEATLKRVYKYENRVELRAENPMYSPLNYEGNELEQVRILGKAVAFQSFVK